MITEAAQGPLDALGLGHQDDPEVGRVVVHVRGKIVKPIL